MFLRRSKCTHVYGARRDAPQEPTWRPARGTSVRRYKCSAIQVRRHKCSGIEGFGANKVPAPPAQVGRLTFDLTPYLTPQRYAVGTCRACLERLSLLA